jgi:hypothetical protein
MACETLMTIDHVGRFAMLRGTLVELPTSRPLEVASAGGALWLTLDDDPRDLVLDHGERVLLEAPNRVLACALDDALMEVRKTSPSSTPCAGPRRGARWWQSLAKLPLIDTSNHAPAEPGAFKN